VQLARHPGLHQPVRERDVLVPEQVHGADVDVGRRQPGQVLGPGLEETLQIVLQLWSDDEGPYRGTHYTLERTLNVPQPLTRPRPPILIGGSGERKTLRMVAQYADACNLFPGPELAHKLAVLREHCDRLGRDYDEIEKTCVYTFDLGREGEHEQRVEQTLADLRAMADLGIQVAHGRVEAVHDLTGLRLLGEQVVPEVASW
jgi:hypothetical protein